ncbi:protein of unknown function [Paraburkholderia kururiensis]
MPGRRNSFSGPLRVDSLFAICLIVLTRQRFAATPNLWARNAATAFREAPRRPRSIETGTFERDIAQRHSRL